MSILLVISEAGRKKTVSLKQKSNIYIANDKMILLNYFPLANQSKAIQEQTITFSIKIQFKCVFYN